MEILTTRSIDGIISNTLQYDKLAVVTRENRGQHTIEQPIFGVTDVQMYRYGRDLLLC